MFSISLALLKMVVPFEKLALSSFIAGLVLYGILYYSLYNIDELSTLSFFVSYWYIIVILDFIVAVILYFNMEHSRSQEKELKRLKLDETTHQDHDDGDDDSDTDSSVSSVSDDDPIIEDLKNQIDKDVAANITEATE